MLGGFPAKKFWTATSLTQPLVHYLDDPRGTEINILKLHANPFFAMILQHSNPQKMPRKSQLLLTSDEFNFLYYKIPYRSISSRGHLDQIYCGITFHSSGRLFAYPFLKFVL